MPYLIDLADACRKSGLKVVERPGWQKRGHGPMGAVRTIVCHHTAGPATGNAPSLGYIERNGLAHIVLARDGTVYVVAAGLCHHAGVVKQATYGNAYAIGIEAEHVGTTPRWPAVQYAAYVRLCRALIDHYDLPVSRVLGHKEVCHPPGRKIDPTFPMPAFREAVATQEDDVALDNDDINRIVNRLMQRNLTNKKGELTVAMALRQSARSLAVTQQLARDLPDAIEKALPEPTTGSGGGGLTRAQVRQAAEQAVRNVLGSLDEEG